MGSSQAWLAEDLAAATTDGENGFYDDHDHRSKRLRCEAGPGLRRHRHSASVSVSHIRVDGVAAFCPTGLRTF